MIYQTLCLFWAHPHKETFRRDVDYLIIMCPPLALSDGYLLSANDKIWLLYNFEILLPVLNFQSNWSLLKLDLTIMGVKIQTMQKLKVLIAIRHCYWCGKHSILLQKKPIFFKWEILKSFVFLMDRLICSLPLARPRRSANERASIY